MKLLIVEDDRKIAAFLKQGLTQAGFDIDHAETGDSGLEAMLRQPYDAAVVDIMLPGLDGLTVVTRAREAGVRTPIIYLSARRELEDRILGLQSGGDDYLTKPFAFSELLARVQALIRRAGGGAEPLRLAVADLEMDLVKRRVTRRGKEVQLQPREFAVLEVLMRHKGNAVSKVMLIERVWGYHFDPATTLVETTVSRLRSRLVEALPDGPELIRTLRGVGYVLSGHE